MQTIKLEIALTDARAAQVFSLLGKVLTEQSNDKPETQSASPEPVQPQKPVTAKTGATPSQRAEEKAVAAVETKAAEPAKETTAENAAGDDKTYTVEEVRELAQSKIKDGKMPQVKEILTSFDAKSITNLEAKHYSAFIQKVNAL